MRTWGPSGVTESTDIKMSMSDFIDIGNRIRFRFFARAGRDVKNTNLVEDRVDASLARPLEWIAHRANCAAITPPRPSRAFFGRTRADREIAANRDPAVTRRIPTVAYCSAPAVPTLRCTRDALKTSERSRNPRIARRASSGRRLLRALPNGGRGSPEIRTLRWRGYVHIEKVHTRAAPESCNFSMRVLPAYDSRVSRVHSPALITRNNRY